MAEANEPHADAPTSKADALALAEAAEAEAAEAEALATAAQARARAARMRREALELEEGGEAGEAGEAGEEQETAAEEAAATETIEYVIPADADDPGDADTAGRRRRSRFLSRSAIGKTVAILLICAFAALSGLMIAQHHKSTQRQERAAVFVAGAKRGVVNMISLDFSKAKEDVQRVIDSSTGKFRDDFASQAAEFTKTVEDSKAVTEGTVTAAALVSMDDHSALVLVAATSRVTNLPAGKEQQPRAWRLKVTVTEDGGQYKMSKVEFVP
jgi:Mce-associated membrane protein